MRDDLPVGEGAIDAGAHRAEITLAKLGADWRAGEFEVRQSDPMRRCRQRHFAKKVGADLVTEPARPAMDADDDLATREAEAIGDGIIENCRDLLHFEIVIAGAERAHLFALALAGTVRDRV